MFEKEELYIYLAIFSGFSMGSLIVGNIKYICNFFLKLIGTKDSKKNINREERLNNKEMGIREELRIKELEEIIRKKDEETINDVKEGLENINTKIDSFSKKIENLEKNYVSKKEFELLEKNFMMSVEMERLHYEEFKLDKRKRYSIVATAEKDLKERGVEFIKGDIYNSVDEEYKIKVNDIYKSIEEMKKA